MREINSKATVTIIWLGKRYSREVDSLKGIEFILAIDKAIISNSNTFESRAELSIAVYQLVKDFIKTNKLNEFRTWMDICGIYLKDWFYRVWVIQECLVSTNTLVFCGPCITQPDIL